MPMPIQETKKGAIYRIQIEIQKKEENQEQGKSNVQLSA